MFVLTKGHRVLVLAMDMPNARVFVLTNDHRVLVFAMDMPNARVFVLTKGHRVLVFAMDMPKARVFVLTKGHRVLVFVMDMPNAQAFVLTKGHRVLVFAIDMPNARFLMTRLLRCRHELDNYIHRTAKETQHFSFLNISNVNIFYQPKCILVLFIHVKYYFSIKIIEIIEP